jgi:hypothetical protein
MKPINLPADTDGRFPFCTMEIDGRAWNITCNGHAIGAEPMVAARYDGPTPERDTAYRAILSLPLRSPDRVLSLGALREVIGKSEPSRQVECPDCGGSGRHREADGDCGCERCRCDSCTEGKVWTSPAKRPMVISGVGINGNLVAVTLGALDRTRGEDPGPIQVWGRDGTIKQTGTLLLVTPGWRAAIVAMRVEADAPRFFEPVERTLAERVEAMP